MIRPTTRRQFLKNSAIGVSAIAVCPLIYTKQTAAADGLNHKSAGRSTLMAHFSHSGNTRHFADVIHSHIGGDRAEIKTVDPYPRDYDAVVKQAREEQDNNFRPVLSGPDIDPKAYDRIFVGYPNWWGTLPMAVFTFFEKYDFSDKPLIAFTTHEGSGFGQSVSDLERLNPRSTVIKGLAIRGRSIKSRSAKTDIIEWLDDLSI